MVATNSITVTFGVRWWLKYYIRGVALMCSLTGYEPNKDRMMYWIDRAIYIK